MNSALSLSEMKKLLLIYQKIYIWGGGRRENIPQTTSWPRDSCRLQARTDVALLVEQHTRRPHKASELAGVSAEPLVFLTWGRGSDSPEK